MQRQIDARKQEIDVLAREMVESGMAAWDGDGGGFGASDRARTVESAGDPGEAEELDRIRTLFDDLERKRDIAEFPGTDRRRRGRAHFYRLREQTFLTFGFLFGGVSIYER